MKVSGTNGMNISAKQMNMSQTSDPVSKHIQKQIANLQKALQELSEKDEISAEEKMKKRQELQQQIADLNQQLRQHQMEQRREQQAKKSSMDDMLGNKQKETNNVSQNGMSKRSMKAMISATSAMGQAEVYESVATHLKGRARTLQSEISLDQKCGINIEDKQKELSKIEVRAEMATSSQISTLEDAKKELKEAKEKDKEEKEEDANKKKNDKKVSGFHSENIEKDKKHKSTSDIPIIGGGAVLSISSNSEKNSGRSVDIQL